MERLLTVEEASQLLSLAPKTLYQYVCRKIVPYVKIQGNLRFRESDLQSWIEQQVVKPLKGSE